MTAAMIGFCRGFQRARGWEVVSDAEIAEGVILARQAIDQGKDDADALWIGGFTLAYVAGEHATAGSVIDRSLKLNPNSAQAWNASGWVWAWRNEPNPAIDAFHRAIRLSPLDPLGYMFLGGLAFAHFVARRYEEAVEWADRCLREQPRFSSVLRVKIASHSHLGQNSGSSRMAVAIAPASTRFDYLAISGFLWLVARCDFRSLM